MLRPPEKHQLGYNNIVLPQDPPVSTEVINEAAALLKLAPESLQQILAQRTALPVARTASRIEAELVLERLLGLGLNCIALGDDELGLSPSEKMVKRVRSMTVGDLSLTIRQAGATEEVAWSDVVLILPARLIETRLEVKERKSRKSENEIIDTSEFFRDEAVIDFYIRNDPSTWRVLASGFDFSCVGIEKALIANENIRKLKALLISKAVNAQLDDSYNRVRQLLELAWGTQQETQSSGWRRERPGKLSVGVATIRSNESQFTRYSRLRYYLCAKPL